MPVNPFQDRKGWSKLCNLWGGRRHVSHAIPVSFLEIVLVCRSIGTQGLCRCLRRTMGDLHMLNVNNLEVSERFCIWGEATYIRNFAKYMNTVRQRHQMQQQGPLNCSWKGIQICSSFCLLPHPRWSYGFKRNLSNVIPRLRLTGEPIRNLMRSKDYSRRAPYLFVNVCIEAKTHGRLSS